MQIRWESPLLRDRRIKDLITSRFENYDQRYALDYCGNLADIVASGILVSYWRRPNSHCFGDRRDCDRNQARHRSRSVGVGLRQELRVSTEPRSLISERSLRPDSFEAQVN